LCWVDDPFEILEVKVFSEQRQKFEIACVLCNSIIPKHYIWYESCPPYIYVRYFVFGLSCPSVTSSTQKHDSL